MYNKYTMREVRVDIKCGKTGQQQQPEWPNDKLLKTASQIQIENISKSFHDIKILGWTQCKLYAGHLQLFHYVYIQCKLFQVKKMLLRVFIIVETSADQVWLQALSKHFKASFCSASSPESEKLEYKQTAAIYQRIMCS